MNAAGRVGDLLHPRGLLPRSTVVILLAWMLAGLAAVLYVAHATQQRAHAAAQTRLNELLDTVESTVQVACFAKDATLAGELAQGLLNSSDVLAVAISADRGVLARAARAGAPVAADATAIRRDIRSPFDAGKVVGDIVLIPDPWVLQTRVVEEIRFAVLQLSWQLAMVAFAVAVVMLLFVVRPIKAMSDRLHRMDPAAGDRLPIPGRHADTEIGQLAGDINELADRLVTALAAERELRIQREIDERKYHALFDNAESGIFLIDDQGALLSWNRAFPRLFGLAPEHAEETLRDARLEALPWLHPARAAGFPASVAEAGAPLARDFAVRLAGGAERWLNVAINPVGDKLLQGVVHDVSHLKEAEARARRQMVTDTLTGLANRAGLEERMRVLMHAGAGAFALLLVDLDQFKRVNEGMGLPAGDEVLKATTARLSNCVKRDDTVARLSADRFGVILDRVADAGAAESIATRILTELRHPYFIDGAPLHLRASIGITLYPRDGGDLPTLLRQAELAMDSAKATGGDACARFDTHLAEAAERRRRLERDLRDAIRERRFELFYQPIIDLRDNRLAGAEALIRWCHPERGLVPPDEFIPLAEKTGLIVDIGLLALDAACQQLSAWNRAGLSHSLSLNVSGCQIPDGLTPEQLLAACHRHGVPPGRLALEITEGVMLRDVEKSLRWLRTVHDMGFRVYLDDFGTGYSSLSYLRLFPVDTLKVDKSFVRDLRADGHGHTLAAAIIAMGDSLGLDVVAEGVESSAQLNALRDLGCRYVQGFLFSRPVPAGDFAAAATRVECYLAEQARAQAGLF